MTRLDHLVYAAPDLDAAIESLERTLGIRAAYGGRHDGRGTHNGLIALAADAYLEIIAPDPNQPAPVHGRWLGVDEIDATPRLVTWAAKSVDLDSLTQKARTHGIPIGRVLDGSRARPDGSMLRWRLTDAQDLVDDGIVPFFIDWGDSPHPAESAPGGLTVRKLHAEHPAPEAVRTHLATLGVSLDVAQGPKPALCAVLETPNGVVTLR